MAWRSGYFALAKMRPDGFAGYEQIAGGSNKTGSIITKSIGVVGNSLCISANVAPSGFVKVTLLNSENEQLAEGELVTATVSDAKIRWKENLLVIIRVKNEETKRVTFIITCSDFPGNRRLYYYYGLCIKMHTTRTDWIFAPGHTTIFHDNL